MTKEKLLAFLSIIPESAEVKMSYTYDKSYSFKYDCELDSINLICDDEGVISAELSFKKCEAEAVADFPDVLEVPVSVSEETGEKMVEDAENPAA